MGYYNRYSALNLKTEVSFFPEIKLEEKETDKIEIYVPGKTRFDKLSDKYFGSPYWGFLIMIANPELEGLEFIIPATTSIRIPFPLDPTVKELKEKIEQKKKYYGT